MKNSQYISTKITINCSCEIYPIKSHVLFTHAAKILHSHNWPDMWTENEIAYIDESVSLINWLSVQRFCISRGTNTRFWRFAEWNHGCLGEKIFGEFIKNNILCSLPWCVWRYRTFLNYTVEHVLKKCGHSERPSSKVSVAKAFLLDCGDTVQNEMTATKHKSFTPDSCPHAPVVKLPPVVDAVTSVVYQR